MVSSRLLLFLPSNTYRAAVFLEAARRLGIALTVATDHRSVFDKAQPDKLLALDFDRPDDVRRQVRAFAAQHPVAAAFGVDDDTAVLAAHASEELGLPHNSVAACLAARDKFRHRSLLAAAGVPVPPFALHRLADDPAVAAASAPYPCVIKPTRLSMSRGVMRVNGREEFAPAVRRLRAILADPASAKACGDEAGVFLVEGYVPGREFAVEGLLEQGRLQVLALFDKPDPLEGPFFEETIYATPSGLEAAAQQAIAACVESAALALGLRRGPVHAEVRLNDQGPWLIELAARPIGGRCSAVLRFGEQGEVTLEELLLAQALGLERSGGGQPAADASAVMMIPVPRPGVLKQITGLEQARLVPWIDDVVITAHPGDTLVPLPEGNRYPGFIFARAADAATAVQAVRQAHALLDFQLG